MVGSTEASAPGLNSPAADEHPSPAAGATSWASRMNPNARTFIMPSEATDAAAEQVAEEGEHDEDETF